MALDVVVDEVPTSVDFAVREAPATVEAPTSVDVAVREAEDGDGDGDEARVEDGDEDDDDDGFFVDQDYEQSDLEPESEHDFEAEERDKDSDYVVHPAEDESDYGRSSILDSQDSSSEGEEAEVDSHVTTGEPLRKRHMKLIRKKLPSFRQWNRQTDLADPKFEIGMQFASIDEVREAVKEYGVKRGRLLTYKKNDTLRFRAICKPNPKQVCPCPFLFYASLKDTKDSEDKTFVLKKYIHKHICVWQTKNRRATSTWLAMRYEEPIINNPSMSISYFQKLVLREYRIDVSRWQVYMAKRKALRQNHEAIDVQYAKLDDYSNELLERNPGSTVIIKCTGEGDARIFQRIYICLAALKNGFKAGCRRMIGVDACHLKGRYKGQLLTVVGIDANNGMFPVAYAVSEIENREVWTWFLELLISDLDIMGEGMGWVFIYDKQKGLKSSVDSLLHNAEHRNCVRHLHANFKLDGHVGMVLKQQLWKIARTSNVVWFNAEMETLRKMSIPAHDWLLVRPPQQWSRAHFLTHSKCDILLNNLCEALNKSLLEARKMPIIAMLEEIRVYLMLRMHKQREVEWEQEVGKRVFSIFERNQIASTDFTQRYAGNGCYEVSSSSLRSFVVDINRKTCSCGRWDLTGIPCCHAISALTSAGRHLLAEVHAWYKRGKYEATYAQHISPMPDSTQWKVCGLPPLKPHLIKAQPGRRKHSRTLGRGECRKDDETLKKIYVQLCCSRCKGKGHNLRTCPKVTQEEREARMNARENARMNARMNSSPEPPAALNQRITRMNARMNSSPEPPAALNQRITRMSARMNARTPSAPGTSGAKRRKTSVAPSASAAQPPSAPSASAAQPPSAPSASVAPSTSVAPSAPSAPSTSVAKRRKTSVAPSASAAQPPSAPSASAQPPSAPCAPRAAVAPSAPSAPRAQKLTPKRRKTSESQAPSGAFKPASQAPSAAPKPSQPPSGAFKPASQTPSAAPKPASQTPSAAPKPASQAPSGGFKPLSVFKPPSKLRSALIASPDKAYFARVNRNMIKLEGIGQKSKPSTSKPNKSSSTTTTGMQPWKI